MANLTTSIVLRLVDRVSAPARRATKSLERVGKAGRSIQGRGPGGAAGRGVFGRLFDGAKEGGRLVSGVGSAAAKTGQALKTLAVRAAVLGGAGFLIGRSFVNTAAEFERFTTILETVEGSSAKARKSMDWISDFAAKTPFEIGEVTASFVKLRAFGIDPTGGTLRALGDAASAMGKDVNQAVEALADAETGEFERLKEFGIKGGVKGNRATFTFTDKDGNQQSKTVDKRNRKIVRGTLLAIWNDKYAGAMDKQSKTWDGMVSNLSDQWTRFKLKVMEAGVFDFLSKKLEEVLSWINQMEKEGKLKKWAEETAAWVKRVVKRAEELWPAFRESVGAIVDKVTGVVDALGGWENSLWALVGVMTVQTAAAMAGLVASVGKLVWGVTQKLIPGLGKTTDALDEAARSGRTRTAPALRGVGEAGRSGAKGISAFESALGKLSLSLVVFEGVYQGVASLLESRDFSELVGMPQGVTLSQGLEDAGARLYERFGESDEEREARGGIERRIAPRFTVDDLDTKRLEEIQLEARAKVRAEFEAEHGRPAPARDDSAGSETQRPATPVPSTPAPAPVPAAAAQPARPSSGEQAVRDHDLAEAAREQTRELRKLAREMSKRPRNPALAGQGAF